MKPWQMMRRFGQPASGGGGGSDPYWANVVSLLHFDGTDGSTSIIDATGRTWSLIGFPEIDTSQSRFGGSSLQWGSPGVRAAVTTPASTAFDLSADFTMEGWVRFADASGDSVFWQLSADIDNWTERFYVLRQSGCLRVAFNYGADYDMSPVGSLPDSTWCYVAIVRYGDNLLLFIDGVLLYTRSMTAWVGTSAQPVLGYPPPEGTLAYQARGHMDEWRFTKGVARYTANFTPPSAPYPDGP